MKHDASHPYRIILIPDTHVPEHHQQAVTNLGNLLAEAAPRAVVHTGDFLNLDAPSVS